MSSAKTTPAAAEANILRTLPVAERSAAGVDGAPLSQSAAALPGARWGWPTIVSLLAVDGLALAVSLGCGFFLVQGLLSLLSLGQGAAAAWSGPTPLEVRVAVCYGLGLSMVFFLRGLYQPFFVQPAAELRLLSEKTGSLTLLFVALLMVTGAPLQTSAALAAAGLLLLLLLPVGRAALRSLCGRARWWGVRAIVVGNADDVLGLQSRMARRSWTGLRPIGYVLVDPPADFAPDANYLGAVESLPKIAAEFGATLGVVAAGERDRDELLHLITCGGSGLRQWILLNPSPKAPSLWAEPCEVAGAQASAIRVELMSAGALAIKRVIDLTLVIGLAVPTLCVVGVLALLVKLSSPGPVFYAQTRIGRFGRRFQAWKFRSMVPNAAEMLRDYLEKNPAAKAEWDATQKLKDDPRITWIGRILRKTSLDELPQVWNVFLGEMSLVGPRPIVDEEVEKLGDVYPLYASAPPGITGLWQISGRNNTTWEERLELTAYYVRNWSPWLDLYILGCTVKTVLLREGAY